MSKRLRAPIPMACPDDVAEATAGKLGAELPQCRNLSPAARRKGQALGTAAGVDRGNRAG